MGRAPCCENMGLKKGHWSKEEDHILTSYINQHGHENWRALPKKSGLLRCGKSCRLRWTNYLRPDIKRGNFTKEEEDTIIHLHQVLGNRWSTIAARLPGRTDNEIKNVWHTNLKKRLVKQAIPAETQNQQITKTAAKLEIGEDSSVVPEISGSTRCSSLSGDVSSSSITTAAEPDQNAEMCVISEKLVEDFWVGVFSSENSGKFSSDEEDEMTYLVEYNRSGSFNSNNRNHEDMDFFWSDLFYEG